MFDFWNETALLGQEEVQVAVEITWGRRQINRGQRAGAS